MNQTHKALIKRTNTIRRIFRPAHRYAADRFLDLRSPLRGRSDVRAFMATLQSRVSRELHQKPGQTSSTPGTQRPSLRTLSGAAWEQGTQRPSLQTVGSSVLNQTRGMHIAYASVAADLCCREIGFPAGSSRACEPRWYVQVFIFPYLLHCTIKSRHPGI